MLGHKFGEFAFSKQQDFNIHTGPIFKTDKSMLWRNRLMRYEKIRLRVKVLRSVLIIMKKLKRRGKL